MKLLLFTTALSLSLGFGSVVLAQSKTPGSTSIISEITSAFQREEDARVPSIQVPTVVEIPFSETFLNRFDFAVLDMKAGEFQPYFFTEHFRTARTPVTVSIEGVGLNASSMIDGDTRTFAEFVLPESEQGQTRLILKSPQAMTLRGITLFLDQYVALPTSIEIRARITGSEKIVLARSKMQGSTIVFPKTSAKEWIASLSYGQPLRITEIVLDEEGAGITSSRTLRFLAQPQHDYRIYFDADRSVSLRVGESANLALDTDILRLAPVAAQANPGYTPADSDLDGVPDTRDNCVSISNADQTDVNANGRGDACDDFDKDGVMNSLDNCVNEPNRNQTDTDGDKIGDVCDHEESRITEKYAWLPWAGMGFAGLVLIVLFAITARSMIKKD
ncbi:MAG: Peptidase S15 [Parcubacteria group bacterium GW2011_GWA1_47_8]|nr:MAG: Peptidase S15 [Parcubacteria group bacterium GW2011_GWA1_47_8]KKW07709.1 MAG: Peptidase S15 [Parcubacteria group bacterium GW2011_GWA2_49_16]